MSMSFLRPVENENKKALVELESRLEKIEGQINTLRLEWTEVYDKVHHALDRIAKRYQRIKTQNVEENQENSQGNGEFVSTADLIRIAREKGALR